MRRRVSVTPAVSRTVSRRRNGVDGLESSIAANCSTLHEVAPLVTGSHLTRAHDGVSGVLPLCQPPIHTCASLIPSLFS